MQGGRGGGGAGDKNSRDRDPTFRVSTECGCIVAVLCVVSRDSPQEEELQTLYCTVLYCTVLYCTVL